MSRVYGVVTGVVRSVDDPSSQGRVLVGLPWLPGDNESYWAPVATLMSGESRGSWFMPEEGDEVLLAFEHGNVDQPFVIGYLWNGIQTPPGDGGHSVRRLKTVSGHVLEFHDEDGGHKILLRSNGGQKVELDDNASSITIETSGGELVKLSPGKVEAATSAGQSIELGDAPPAAKVQAGPGTIQMDASGVTVTHPGSVAVDCTTADLTAAAAVSVTAPTVTVSAPVTTFAGVVMAQVLIADAVVGSAYTPAPGNTFGL